ncbi:hypothetical protein GUJ93_ZPchr0465g6475 [Zizania palustris]|uniref:S-acyltransferase n=1 Tax=Zizania palustris TaxID=103762 RepID=A0A8J5R132_ZIZPA|nr:hypothetical protein GUJ93_ZPchr0465g6475 [Zizania palustris]
MILIIGTAMYSVPIDEQAGNDSSRTSIIICGIVLCPLTLALTVLLGWHIYLIIQNKTTIEYHEGVRAMWLAQKGGNLYHHPYHLGVYENLISVLGPNIFCWLCPVSNNTGFATLYNESRTSGFLQISSLSRSLNSFMKYAASLRYRSSSQLQTFPP